MGFLVKFPDFVPLRQLSRVHPSWLDHGHTIKWTQHIGFLTLAQMVRVVEGNHGNDSKEG